MSDTRGQSTPEPRFISFREVPALGKTKRWEITTKDGKGVLGLVKFYPQWRRYAYFPYVGTLYDQDCLRDIALFCETKTREWRSKSIEQAALEAGASS